ncbi:ComEC family competence protein [Litoribacter ruber]|uniref:ComEC/Rec2 family competence protein n=1 Tax=Litoribacter ruber TaxID=702568 RepID=UPI001BDAFB7F|nr:ComEC/Rec2 family competence protein [Litoribacter ruber]MBT0811480.1 ComEC family competence protein [Litoribacter ruber]
MLHFGDYPFVRYTVFFTLGILCYAGMGELEIYWLYGGFLFCFAGYYFLLSQSLFQKGFSQKLPLSIAAYAVCFSFGLVLSGKQDVLRNPIHIVNSEEVKAWIGVAQDRDEPKPKSNRNLVNILEVEIAEGWVKSEGRVIIYHKDSLNPGDVILVGQPLQRATGFANSEGFDYPKFLARQQIFHSMFVSDLKVIDKVSNNPLRFFFEDWRGYYAEQIELYLPSESSRQIAKALLLGQKRNLDKEITEAFSTAGAMHVLAVSGLHVGIIYGFFFLFFKPNDLPTFKRFLFLSGLIILIWGYAFVTGLSPSVLRSATMFTLMALAQMQSRSPSVFNAVAISAMLILVFDPNMVYNVGFQLSYAALLGILLFQPLMVKLWLPKNRVLGYFWVITSVGIAAQLGTFPISGYYFQQFPVYFMFSNLVAIPGAFFIMAIGIPFLLLSGWTFAAIWLGKGLGLLIGGFNAAMFFIQDLPYSKIANIGMDGFEIFGYYVLVSLMLLLFHAPNRKVLIGIMLLVFLGGVHNWVKVIGSGKPGLIKPLDKSVSLLKDKSLDKLTLD